MVRTTAKRGPSRSNTTATLESAKETIESLVMAFILAFTFRAYIVEAFVIPTGSMAPTLLGQHLRIQCSQCGYRFRVDMPEPEQLGINHHGRRQAASYLENDVDAYCPMCRFPNFIARGTHPRAGDRILVHKYVYSVHEPRRWDIVVFKAPKRPAENFIKRLVGLPGENLLIVEGNVYVKPRAGDESKWRIARKTDEQANPHATAVQRAVWQPVYHSQYLPRDDGKVSAFRPHDARWRCPWIPTVGDWQIEDRHNYRHNSADRGVIEFDFAVQGSTVANRYPYNQFKLRGLYNSLVIRHGARGGRNPLARTIEPVEDVRIAAAFMPDSKGLTITLRTSARLDKQDLDAPPTDLVARIDANGQASLIAPRLAVERGGGVLKTTTIEPLHPGRATTVELWHVDQEASLWVDGRAILRWQIDFDDFESVRFRRPLDADWYPRIAIEVTGSPVTLHRIEVDRDIVYASTNLAATLHRGTLVKSNGQVDGTPVDILPRQYFCLGDNSPLSHDGRYWDDIDRRIRETMLTDPEHALGVVPQKLMTGRAFFVYFPAPYSVGRNGPAFVPNFGDMRFIR